MKCFVQYFGIFIRTFCAFRNLWILELNIMANSMLALSNCKNKCLCAEMTMKWWTLRGCVGMKMLSEGNSTWRNKLFRKAA